MRTRSRARACACLIAGTVAVDCAAAPAADAVPAPPTIPARAWVLIDAGDHTRLAASDAAASLPMASATKLMTAYLALRRLPLDKRLAAPPYHAMPGESLLGLREGERMSVRDLLYGLLLPSGNDAAVTLADGVAGSTPSFVEEMNAAARRLGLSATGYGNPIGLDQSGNYSSPLDLATLTVRLRRERIFRRIVDTARTTLRTGDRPRTIVNHNELVLRVPWINGVKTGYTLDAGYVLVGSGTREGVTLLSVVMGAPSMRAREADTLDLMRYGYSLYRRETPVDDGDRLARRTVPNGEGSVSLVAGRSVQATVRRGQRVEVSVDAPRSVRAPIERGDRIGSASVAVDGEVVGMTPLVARHSVSVASAESIVAHIDDALPGSRAVVWALTTCLVGTIVIVIGLLLARRRRH
jgi:serine-type D-Ala-D-Ala carboxypeptidase (penicillin-binding protein 5/6)